MEVHIIVGTTSGNTEFMAEALADVLREEGHQVIFHDQPEYAAIPKEKTLWLSCIATHGAGEYPETLIDFMETIESEKPDLSGVQGAMVSIGDSSYDTFCEAGKSAETLFRKLGMVFICPVLTIDMLESMDPDAEAVDWLNSWKTTISE